MHVNTGRFFTYESDKNIGNSMYRICNTDPINGKGEWYIHETFNDGSEWSGYNAHHSDDLGKIIDIFNSITVEKAIVSLKH